MHLVKFGVSLAAALIVLTACHNAQPASDIPERASSEFRLTKLHDGLANPWSVAELPGGGYLITEKYGGLLHFTKQGARREVKNIPQDIFAKGQGGLLDIVLAPDFAATQEVYLSYSYGEDDANGTALLRAKLIDDALENKTIIFRASPPKTAASHFGGKILFLPDDTLLLSLGDGFAYREDAQKADTHLGKIVRLTRDGGVPADNPFLGQSKNERAFKPQIFSLGHRNVQGLARDPETGALWEHEHGPYGGDELNLLQSGKNYGWPLATKGRDYQGARISPYETFEGTIDAVHGWSPSIAPSGLIIYRGAMFPEWNGDALIGGLASRDLRRIDLENGQSAAEEALLSDLNLRIRDVRQAGDGAILLLAEDGANGQLLKLTPR